MFNKNALDVSPSVDHKNILKTMWRKSYPGLAAIGVFTVFFNILRLATALYALNVFDRVVASRSVETLVMLTIAVLIAVFVGALLGVIRRVMLLRWGGWIEGFLGPSLFEIGFAKAGESPSLASLLRDVGRIRGFVSGTGLVAWLDVFWAPIFAVIVFLISPAMGWIVAIASVIVLILGVLMEISTRESRDATFVARSDDERWVASAERHRETIGSLAMGSSFADQWFRSASERLDESERSRRIGIYYLGGMRFVRRCLRIAVLGVGCWLVIGGSMTVGAVIASYYLGRISFSLVQDAMLKWREMINARRSYRRICAALRDHEGLRVSSEGNRMPVPLVFDRVSFRYPRQSNSIFRGINIVVKPGEALYVIGPSAVGKTTFARLAAGVTTPKSGQSVAGQVRLGDVSVHRLVQAGERCYVGYLPQHIQLFDGTIRENIARMRMGDMGLVVEAAKLAGIHEAIVRLPEGYDTVITEDEPLLSTGQRKGVALARAFYGWPSLIVLDEPEPHLDRQQRTFLNTAIKTLKSQGAILVVTSQLRLPSPSIADKVLLLEPGKATLLEGPEEIGNLRRPRNSKTHIAE